MNQKSDRAQKERRKQVNVRLTISSFERMETDRKVLNLSQSDFLVELIEKRTLVRRRDDGLQIALLKSLHTLDSLLKSETLTTIDRQEKAQKLFDHCYEIFFQSMGEAAEQEGENADEGAQEPVPETGTPAATTQGNPPSRADE